MILKGKPGCFIILGTKMKKCILEVYCMVKTYECPKLETFYFDEEVVRTSLNGNGEDEQGLNFADAWGNNG